MSQPCIGGARAVECQVEPVVCQVPIQSDCAQWLVCFLLYDDVGLTDNSQRFAWFRSQLISPENHPFLIFPFIIWSGILFNQRKQFLPLLNLNSSDGMRVSLSINRQYLFQQEVLQ